MAMTAVKGGRNLGIIRQVEHHELARELLAVCVAIAALSIIASTTVLVGSKLNPQRLLGRQVGTLGASFWLGASVISVIGFSILLNHYHRKNNHQLTFLHKTLRERPRKTLERIQELEQHKTHEKELQDQLERQVLVDQRLREQGGIDEQEIALLDLQLQEAREELLKTREGLIDAKNKNLENESFLRMRERSLQFKTNLIRKLTAQNESLEAALKEQLESVEKLEKNLQIEQRAKDEAFARLPDWLQNESDFSERHYTPSGLPTPTTFKKTFEEFAPNISKRINIAEINKLKEEMGAFTVEQLLLMIERKYFQEDPSKLYFLNYEQIERLTPEFLENLSAKEIGYIFFGDSRPSGSGEEKRRFSYLSSDCVNALLKRFTKVHETHFLEALSVHHIQHLDYSLVSSVHLDQIFPLTSKNENKTRFAYIPKEKLDELICKKKLAPNCLEFISETQLYALQPITMQKLTADQVYVLFPKNASGKQRYCLLSEKQKEGLKENDLLAVKMIVRAFENVSFPPQVDEETKELLSKMRMIVEEEDESEN